MKQKAKGGNSTGCPAAPSSSSCQARARAASSPPSSAQQQQHRQAQVREQCRGRRHPHLCLFRGHRPRGCQSHQGSWHSKATQPSHFADEQPGAWEGEVMARQWQSWGQIPRLMTSTSVLLLPSPLDFSAAGSITLSHPQTCWQARKITHVSQKQFANINNFQCQERRQ